MTDEERRAVEDRLRAELEADHRRRVEQATAPSPLEQAAREEAARRERERLEAEVREAFYLEKGYKRYENSRGQIEWLLPDEYERRMRRRKRTRSPRGGEERASPQQLGFAFLLSLALGVLIALVVLRG